jgi:hypothetical protein
MEPLSIADWTALEAYLASISRDQKVRPGAIEIELCQPIDTGGRRFEAGVYRHPYSFDVSRFWHG